MLYCLEMTTPALVKKWISHKTQIPINDLTTEDIQNALIMAAEYPADLLFGYTRQAKPAQVMDTIRQTVRRYGSKFVAFDNLQLLCRSITHAAQETASVCKDFKMLAMELGIVIFLILQPRKLQEDGIADFEDIANTGMVEKDVDALICLHRNKLMGKLKGKDFDQFGKLNSDTSFCPQLLVNVPLARNAPGGMTTLFFEGSTSTVTEISAAKAKAQAKVKEEEMAAPDF